MPRRSSSLTQVVDGAIDREINSKYDDVKIVADNIDDVIIVANATTTTAAVAASIGVVTAVVSNIDAVVDVHNNAANIATIIDNFTNIDTVASNIVDVNDVADSIVAVNTVNNNIAEVHAVVNSIANIGVVAGSIAGVNTVASNMADISTISVNIADVSTAVDNIAQINQVAADTVEIHSIVNTVIPNIAEILQADSNAVIATAQAGLANAARVAAETAKGIAEGKAAEASLSAIAADTSADLAAISESVANTKAGEASASATAAHNSELAAAAILDAFDDVYLGAYTNNPTVDNDGNPLASGALYFNTVAHSLRVYDAGMTEWIALVGASFADMQDVLLTSVSTGDMLKWNGSKWINTKVVGLTSLQLLGGVSTQGTMTWNADEETVDLVQNGATLQIGQELQTHVRNGTASTIANGRVVMATGTIGTSGRIVAGLYDGTSAVKYILGVTTEDVIAGDDGKVTHFGKVRGINTSAWNEYDLLYPTANGLFTNAAPTTGVRVALAMVVTKHATNGTIMVRANGVDELAYEPKNVNIQTHIASTSNPHSVTKAQVGLSNVDNTSDATKNVLSATKWTDGRTITIGSTGKSVDGSSNVSWSLAEIGAQAAGSYQTQDATLTALASVVTAADKLVYATGVDAFTTTALTAAGRALLDDTDAAAQRATLEISATNTPSTAVGGIIATNVQAAIAELDSEKVAKVTSTDNAIARFDGTTGAIQNSGVVIDDSGNVGMGVTPSSWNANSKVIEIGNSTAIENFSIAGADALSVTNNAYRNTSNAFIYKESDYASNYYQFDGSHVWQTASSGIAGNAIPWNIGMRLDTSSNLTVTGTVQGTQLKSTIVTGTAPLVVTSTTPVPNLTATNLSGGSVDATTGSFSGDVTFSGNMKKNGGIIVPMYVQSTEPTAEVGESVLWLETRGNGRFSLWIKEG